MYKKENFLPTAPTGYIVQAGKCITSDNKNPLSRTYLNYDNAKCLALCNNDDNCSGYSFDTSNTCKIFNPTLGAIKAPTSDSDLGYIVNKGDGSNLSVCYIRNNKNQDILPNYEVKLNTNASSGPPYINKYTSFNNCKNTCDLDSSCNGFRYDKNGHCEVYNPIIPSTAWVNRNIPLTGFSANADYNIFIKSTSTTTTTTSSSAFNAVIDSKFTLLGNTGNYTKLSGYGTINNNSTTEPTRISWTGRTIKECYTGCNIDPLCSGYAYASSSNKCLLYNHSFSQTNAGNADYYKPVMSSVSSASWETFIKPRPVPTGFTIKEGGQCRTSNNKEIPYTALPTSYSMCATMCNNDSLCSGYSYGDNGNCILYDITDPITTPSNGDISGTLLTNTNVDFQYNCYIKNNPVTTSIASSRIVYTKQLVDMGCWTDDVNRTISPILINLDIATAQSIWTANMTTTINITIPSQLVGKHSTQADLNALNEWAINIAFDNGYDTIAFQNGHTLSFGRKGASMILTSTSSTYKPITIYSYDRLGAATGTCSLFGGAWINHVFTLQITTTKLLTIPTRPTTTSSMSSTRPTTTAAPPMKIVKSALDLITITLNNTFMDHTDNIDTIIYNIKNIIDPDNKYTIVNLYNKSTNTLLLTVSKSSTAEQFINKEHFESSDLIVKIKYNDNIQMSDPNSLNRIMGTSLDNIITPIPMAVVSAVSISTWDKYKTYFIIAIVILVLLIFIAIFLYFKSKKALN